MFAIIANPIGPPHTKSDGGLSLACDFGQGRPVLWRIFTLLFPCSEEVLRLVKEGGGRVEIVVAALHPSLAPVEVAACLGA